MLNADQIAQVSLGVVIVIMALAPASIIFAWLLRRSGIIGGPVVAGILGGVIAGGLLGASVLGKSAPDAYAAIYVGGVNETAALDEASRSIERELAALGASGVSHAAIEEHRSNYNEKLAAYVDQVNLAKRNRAWANESAALLLACTVMALGAGWMGRVRTRALTSGAVASGFGMVIGAGIPVFIMVAWLGGYNNVQAWTLGAAIGIGSAWPTLNARLHGSAGRSPETDASGLVALAIGLSAILIAIFSTVEIRSFAGGWAVVFACVAIIASAWRIRNRRPRSQRRAIALCQGVVIPTLAATCIAPIDLSSTIVTRACIIASIAAVLFASDGRWFGAWLGWRLFGDASSKQTAWRRSAATLANNVGAISIGVSALGRSAGLIDSAGMIAVILGALLVEITTGFRRRFAVRFDTAQSMNHEDDANSANDDVR